MSRRIDFMNAVVGVAEGAGRIECNPEGFARRRWTRVSS
jgi:hypothetical protein